MTGTRSRQVPLAMLEHCYWCGAWNEAERGIPADRCYQCKTRMLADSDHLVARVVAMKARQESPTAAELARNVMPERLQDPTALVAERELAARVELAFAPHIAQIEWLAQIHGIVGLGADVHRRLVMGMPYADERLLRMCRFPPPHPGVTPDRRLSDFYTWWNHLHFTQWRTPLIGLAEMAVLEARITSGNSTSIHDAAENVISLISDTDWRLLHAPAIRLLAQWEIWWNAPGPSWDKRSKEVVRELLFQFVDRDPWLIGRIASVLCTDGVDPVVRITEAFRAYWEWSEDHPGLPALAQRVLAQLEQALTCDDDAAVMGAALALARADVLVPRCTKRTDLIAPTVRVLSRAGRGIPSLRVWLQNPEFTPLVLEHLRGSWIDLAADLVAAVPCMNVKHATYVMEAFKQQLPFEVQWQAAQGISDPSLWKRWTMPWLSLVEDAQIDALLDVVHPSHVTQVLSALLTERRSGPTLLRLTSQLAARDDAPLTMASFVGQRLVTCDVAVPEVMSAINAYEPLMLAVLREYISRLREKVADHDQVVTLVLALERHHEPLAQALGREFRRKYDDIVPPDAAALAAEGRQLVLSDRGQRFRAAVAEFGSTGLPDMGALAHENGITPFLLGNNVQRWLRDESKPVIIAMLSHLTATMEPDALARCLGFDRNFIGALDLTALAIETDGSSFSQLCVRALRRQIESDKFARGRVQEALAACPKKASATTIAVAIGFSGRDVTGGQ